MKKMIFYIYISAVLYSKLLYVVSCGKIYMENPGIAMITDGSPSWAPQGKGELRKTAEKVNTAFCCLPFVYFIVCCPIKIHTIVKN